MNDTENIVRYLGPGFGASADDAKAALLNWADAVDARSRASRPNLTTIATMGGLALLGSFVIGRVLLPRRRTGAPGSRVARVGARLVSWTLVVRAAQFFLPIAIRATQSIMARRAAH